MGRMKSKPTQKVGSRDGLQSKLIKRTRPKRMPMVHIWDNWAEFTRQVDKGFEEVARRRGMDPRMLM